MSLEIFARCLRAIRIWNIGSQQGLLIMTWLASDTASLSSEKAENSEPSSSSLLPSSSSLGSEITSEAAISAEVLIVAS